MCGITAPNTERAGSCQRLHSWDPEGPLLPEGGWARLTRPCLLDPLASFAAAGSGSVSERPSFPPALFQVLLLIPSLSSQRTLISRADLSI